ncbi:60S ribosomal protein L7-2 [Linum perenne]
MAEVAKPAAFVPESVLKKRKREEEWALAKSEAVVAQKKKSAENRKIIFKRAEQYAIEYKEQERELIRLKREAKLKGGFYVSPEPKLLFIVRIRGINAVDPKTKKILQLLRLRQVVVNSLCKVNCNCQSIVHEGDLIRKPVCADIQWSIPQGQQGYSKHAPPS